MNNYFYFSVFRICTLPFAFCFLILNSCKTDPLYICSRPSHNEPTGNISKIAFGSCSREDKDQPILNSVVAKQPDLFVYLGDNIYGDTEDMNVLLGKYGQLSCKSEFQNLLSNCKVIATWDDHDYGIGDGGKEYPKKEESKNIFLDFWNEPTVSERRNHKGIYTSYYYGDSAHLVQIILLDSRTFRSSLIENANGNYVANYDSSATMLGDAQWNWFKNELAKSAQIRIIGSGTQFARAHNGWEAWANFPLEQNKMFQAIKDASANGVIFISGDVHISELSKMTPAGIYPVYDMTSSGLTQEDGESYPNANRIGENYIYRNFGMIEIDWNQSDPEIFFKGFDEHGGERISYPIHLSEIHF